MTQTKERRTKQDPTAIASKGQITSQIESQKSSDRPAEIKVSEDIPMETKTRDDVPAIVRTTT